MNKILERISFYGMFLFALIGIMLISTATHELSHFNDFKNYSTGGNVCLFNIPTDGKNLFTEDAYMGIYSFYMDKDTEEDEGYKKTNKYTELKARIFDLIILGIFGFFFYILLCERLENNWRRELWTEN